MEILFYTQMDERWSDQIMTQKQGVWVDYLWRWGCYVTALSNGLNTIMKTAITPKEMNDLIKNIKGYRYLKNPNTPEPQASYIEWDVIEKSFSSLKIKGNLDKKECVLKNNTFYVARVIHPKTNGSHYINILDKKKEFFICFDVEDGLIKKYSYDEIQNIRSFERVKK